jgi:hypothetical protein
MRKIDRIYGWLNRLASREGDALLAAALERAEPDYAERLAALLLARQTDTAWAGLVSNYERLETPTRSALLGNEPLRRAALARALASGVSRTRISTLTYLSQHPCPAVSHHVAEALRDSSLRVRELASFVLRCTASVVLTAARQPRRAEDPSQYTADRAAVVAALTTGLRTFELHHRSELLEVCLWFARDLGDELWESLSIRRAHSAFVVREQLGAWNHPRLAAFLLLSLAQPGWRTQALNLLRTWQDSAAALALLDQSDLLQDPAISEQLRLINGYGWLAALGPALPSASPQLQACVPLWISHLGFTDAERIQLLCCCLTSPTPEVQRAAVVALLDLDHPRATAALVEVSHDTGPLGEYVRNCMRARSAGGARPPRSPHSTVGAAS